MIRIKKGDTVKISTGKDRGKTGKVLRVLVKENRVLIEGLNIFKKHRRPRREGEKGETILVPRPMQMANVLPVCPSCGIGVRIATKGEGEGRLRSCRKCGTIL